MKKFIIIVLLSLLFYTRFIGLDWGLPYPMHPDERNMAVAIQQLSCSRLPTNYQQLTTCLNPHFFAYGQFPLYLAYGGIQLSHLIWGANTQPTYIEATMALRILSALSSVLLVLVLMKIMRLLVPKKSLSTLNFKLLAFIFLIFQPYAIQFAHFGTTESLLMLFFALIVYFSLKLIANRYSPLVTILFLGLFSGLALGTKMSSLIFLAIPVFIVVYSGFIFKSATGVSGRVYRFIILSFVYLSICLLVFALSSPHSLLNWNDFIGSMNYESAIGLGTYKAFYTRQFENTIPLLFQFEKILPYVLGWPQLILGILGFIFLPSYIVKRILQVALVKGPITRGKSAASRLWQLLSTDGKLSLVTESAKLIDILRFALLLSFLPVSFFFAKWTRFIAPAFPIFSLFAILFLIHFLRKNRVIFTLVVFATIIPGVAYLSVYLTPDIRFTASGWIYKNIPAQSKILTETANVIDLPIISPTYQETPKNYLISSFNFYDLDVDHQLQLDLSGALNQADYIIVPSRRIFKNHPKNMYPILADYYEKLFSSTGEYEKIIEFSSYPKITLFGKNLIELPDENAEETWTVFDHPVVRIYKRITNNKSQISNQIKTTNNKIEFSKYQTTRYQLLTTNYSLLVADTPEKWKQGLMFVTNKQDIGGLDGMIFNFPDSQIRTFWNKNTLSHLTLYWIANGKVIGISDLPSIIETKVVTTVSSPSAADTVIEIIR